MNFTSQVLILTTYEVQLNKMQYRKMLLFDEQLHEIGILQTILSSK